MLAEQTTTTGSRRTGPLPLKPREEEMRELSAHMNAALYRWLELIREHYEDGYSYDPALRSYAHWVSWRCGVSVAEAREYVRVAKRLPELPVVSAAFARGELSYAKVRSLTRVADPRDEEALVRLAGNLTTSQLERIVQVYRRVT